MPTQFEKFKDLSITFKKHPVTDDLVTVKDKSAVAQSIKGLLLTRRGERPFQPEIGSGLQNLLFEPLDYGTAGLIKSSATNTTATSGDLELSAFGTSGSVIIELRKDENFTA